MAVSSNVPAIWTPCANASASTFRTTKSVLSRGEAIIVSDGDRMARAKALNLIMRPTVRGGVRVDVLSEPRVDGCARAAEMVRSNAVWFLRDPLHIQDLPIVRWYRRDPTGVDWGNLDLHPQEVSSPMSPPVLDEVADLGNHEEVHDTSSQIVDSIPAYAWKSVFSSSLAALCTSHHRWWHIPLILGVGTGTVVWHGSHEDGPFADLVDLETNLVSNVHYAWIMLKAAVFWIFFLFATCTASY